MGASSLVDLSDVGLKDQSTRPVFATEHQFTHPADEAPLPTTFRWSFALPWVSGLLEKRQEFSSMDEIVKDFLIESAENLDRLDQDLVKLEVDPSSKELLASIFRTIHTIKGSCGFLGFARLEKLAHAGESLLSKLRDGELILTAEITSALLSMVDGVRRMLGQIQATEKDGDDDHAALIGHLTQLQTGSHAPANQNLTSSPASAKSDIPVPAPTAECNDSAEKPDPAKIGGVLIEQGKIRPEDLASALEIQELGRRKIGETLIAQGALRPEDVAAAQQAVQQRNPDSPVETIRVGVNLLDRLMNLVGELVLARNQLLQFSNSTQDTAFQAVSQRMNLIATELQEEVMKTRMQPIGNVWNKFPRVVRDLALTAGKRSGSKWKAKRRNSTTPSLRLSKIR